MYEETLATQNPHWQGDRYDHSVPRSCFRRLLDYLKTGQVIAITGVRRAGKSTLVKQLIDHLIENQSVNPHNILFLNLEHPYLSPHREDPTFLQKLYEDYCKMMDPSGEVYVLLDEVQFFRDWPLFVKAHHETKKVRFVVTGSNAVMLSSDMVTLLSGRSLPLEVFPFSLRELALSIGLDCDDPTAVAQHTLKLRKLFDQLLQYGGFPTVAVNLQNQTAFDILGAHARTVLLQDVAPRLGVRKPADLERLYVYLVSHIGKPFSYSSLSKLFGLSDKSIKEYIQALGDAHLLYEVDRFAYSLKKQHRSPKKIYSIDTGQANAMGFKFSANSGRLLENLIYIDLKRLHLETYYYRTHHDFEVDFIIKEGSDLSLVQVAWDLSDPDTKEREIRALLEAMKELKAQTATIIIAEDCASPKVLTNGIKLLSARHYLIEKPEKRKQILLGY